MATALRFSLSIFVAAAVVSFSLFPLVRSDDASSRLLQGINQYRASLNLSALTENGNAACLADQIAKQFKNQECTNSTGSNTVPGTEQQFPNYPDFLNECHLNTTVTRDGQIMPACVPNLDSGLVLSNFTKSQYSGELNDTRYTGAGIASEGNWIVVVLSTNTPEGNFGTVKGGSSVLKVSLLYHSLLLLLSGSLMILKT